jgi:hypothetical protein
MNASQTESRQIPSSASVHQVDPAASIDNARKEPIFASPASNSRIPTHDMIGDEATAERAAERVMLVGLAYIGMLF